MQPSFSVYLLLFFLMFSRVPAILRLFYKNGLAW